VSDGGGTRSAVDAVTAAIAVLVAAGAAAELPAGAVTDEAAAFAAALSETAPGAPVEWASAVGRPSAEFGSRAARGRAWRRQPTPLLAGLVAAANPAAPAYAAALAQLASAACSLGEPTLRAIDVASLAAAAQLRSGGRVAALTSYLPTSGTAGPGTIATPGAARSVPGAPVVVASPTPAATAVPAVVGAPAAPPPPTLEELNATLDGLIGLDSVKAEVHEQAQLLHNAMLRREAGLRVPDVTRHLVFTGNPGTGKTVVARLVAGIYRALGACRTGQLVETARDGLVAGYEGQTAIKTADVVRGALGGVLFIDEAYALAGDAFGDEAIATLLKLMDDHRDDLVVIVAGYPDEMAAFLETNPGLGERFYKTIAFPDYSDDELVAIFERDCAQDDYTPAPALLDRVRISLAAAPRDRNFANGRFVRNLFQAAFTRQAARLDSVGDPTVEQLRDLTADDAPEPTLVAPAAEGASR
jgi:AAA lid domain/ATPase family associated with various cellular activities (AAA)